MFLGFSKMCCVLNGWSVVIDREITLQLGFVIDLDTSKLINEYLYLYNNL